jgi:hypothetical protein
MSDFEMASSEGPPPLTAETTIFDLIVAFDAQFRGLRWVDDDESQRPTGASVRRIETHFGIKLPADLVHLARRARHARSFLLEFGPDEHTSSHVIRCNSYWRRRRRTRRLPRNLIILNQGYMDDLFWCLDIAAPTADGADYAVRFWCPDPIQYPGERPTERYPDFRSFLHAHIYWNSVG